MTTKPRVNPLPERSKREGLLAMTTEEGRETTPSRGMAWPFLAIGLAIGSLLVGAQAASATTGPGVCSNNKTAACSADADCGAGTCEMPTAGGQTQRAQVCMQTAAGQGLQCTANDIDLAFTTSLRVIDGCAFPGDTATISFVAQFNLTAQDRYDIGVWVAEDGGNALTGSCSVSDFPISPTPPWTNLNAAGQPTDTCGDMTSTNNPLFSNIQNIKVSCVDTNGDGNLDINTCLSWRTPGADGLCTSPVQAFPGAPSRCRCQTLPGIAIPVPGVIKVDMVTDPAADPTSFHFTLNEPGGAMTPFSLTDQQAPFNSGGLPLGMYSVGESVPADWTLTSSSCTSDQVGRTATPGKIVLHSGETVTCTFIDKQKTAGFALLGAADAGSLSFLDTTVADFSLGTLGANTRTTSTGDGEVALQLFADEFSATSLSTTDWDLSASGTCTPAATVGGGQVTLSCAHISTQTATFGPGSYVEFYGTIGADQYHYAGFTGQRNFAAGPWAMFGTEGARRW